MFVSGDSKRELETLSIPVDLPGKQWAPLDFADILAPSRHTAVMYAVRILVLLTILSGLVCVAACGNKGDLYLPESEQQQDKE